MNFELLFLLAIMADLLLGDPRWFPHPVRFIGWLCLLFEGFFRKNIQYPKIAGILTSMAVLSIGGGGAALLLFIAGLFSAKAQIIIAVFFLYTFIAIKDLFVHSKAVFNCLFPSEEIIEARLAIGCIVGRDTTHLEAEEISRACIETLAENMVDGITSPIFWATFFSLFSLAIAVDPIVLAAIGIVFYKAVNTMDSMFGYKNERYLDFGWFAARLDDWVNFIPARLSGICVVIGTFCSGNNWRNSLKYFLSDRLNHTSPNAGQTESAIAGALDIQLGGASYYFGEKIEKPTMGKSLTAISPHHILKTHSIILTSSALFLLFSLFFRKIILLYTGTSLF